MRIGLGRWYAFRLLEDLQETEKSPNKWNADVGSDEAVGIPRGKYAEATEHDDDAEIKQ